MKVIFLIILICVTCEANESDKTTSGSDHEDSEVDTIKLFEKKVKNVLKKVTKSTEETIALVKTDIEKQMRNSRSESKVMLKNLDELAQKFHKIKSKSARSLNQCKDKFIGESSILGHLLALKDEIDLSVKEVKECPIDMGGVECLINTMIRGEVMMDEADGLIANEIKDKTEQRAEKLIKWIHKCNEKTITELNNTMDKWHLEAKNCAS